MTLGDELASLAKRVAATEKNLNEQCEKAIRIKVFLDLAVETLAPLAEAVETRGGYAKGSPLDKAVAQAKKIIKEAKT